MTSSYIKPEYLHSETTGQIIKAAQIIHRELGMGYKEIFYQRALARELEAQNLFFAREVEIDVFYKGLKLGHIRVDFIVGEVMVEIKAKTTIESTDISQTLSYLKASGYKIALLLNFGAPKVGIKRLAL